MIEKRIVVFPDYPNQARGWALKTSIGMHSPTQKRFAEHGFHIAFCKNRTHLPPKKNAPKKLSFVIYYRQDALTKVRSDGMSCGGAHALTIWRAISRKPAAVIDAPVVNYLSTRKLGNPDDKPCGEDFVKAYRIKPVSASF